MGLEDVDGPDPTQPWTFYPETPGQRGATEEDGVPSTTTCLVLRASCIFQELNTRRNSQTSPIPPQKRLSGGFGVLGFVVRWVLVLVY